MQAITSSLLSWIDSGYVPQIAYDCAANTINGAVNALVSQLRGITSRTIALGQDPAAFVVGRYQVELGRIASLLCNALQPLVGLPIIGVFASRYISLISSAMSTVGGALGNLRRNGQAAQAVALEIASILQNIARQIR